MQTPVEIDFQGMSARPDIMGYWQLRRYWSGVTLPYTWLNPSTRPRTRRPGRKGMAKRKGLPTGLGWPTTGNARSLASAALVVLLTLISTIDAAETNICKVSANPTGFDHQQITLEGIVAGLTKSTSRSGRKDMTFLLRSPVGCGGGGIGEAAPATLKMLATLSGAATAGSFALFLISSARRLRFRDANSRIERTHDSVHRPPPPSM
jgi:hypothetical protein